MIQMVSLFNLFVNNKNKPKSSSLSSAVKRKRDLEEREGQRKNSKGNVAKRDVNKNSVEKSITDSALKVRKHSLDGTLYTGPQSGNSGSGGNSGGGTSDYSSNGGSDSSSEGSNSAEQKAKQKAQKRALASIRNMKDSNVPFHYRTDYSDLWNQATVQKQNDVWIMKEEVFIYTFHDKQRHRYLNSLSIDCDKGDIVGTSQVTFPYDQRLMEYWIPGKTTFAIVGGTFDREVLFVGRVSEVNQRGDQIEMVGQNIGWKFKAYMSEDFQNSLEGMTVKNAVKLIFKQLGFTKGRYHIDLRGIPDLDKYKIGEDCSVEKDGESVQNVPDLVEVVKNIGSYDIDKYIAKQAKTRDTQVVADDYDKKSSMVSMDRAINSGHYYFPSSLRQNYGISTKYEKQELLYTPILDKIQGSQKLEDFLVKGYSGGGDYTYEEVLHNIVSSIDAHFFIIDTTVCFMSFNALLAQSQIIQKNIIPTIEFWQLQEDSYELDLNQYGYYNTVYVKYKNGIVRKSYDDLVRVFDEIPITYNEPKLDYQGAMLKAQAYLSAHIRDFGMELKATILHTGKIIPSTFIKLQNPLTMSEGLFFIQGTSIQWSSDNQTLICDLDLRFGPENPDGLEIPEAGVSYLPSNNGSSSGGSVSITSGNVSANITQAAREMVKNYTANDDKVLAIYNWVDQYVKYQFYYGSKYSSEEVLQKKRANCYDTAYLVYKLCSAVDVKCEVWNGTYHFLNGNYGHLWNKIYYKGKMVFADTGRSSKNPIGQHGAGRHIISGRCVAKNY